MKTLFKNILVLAVMLGTCTGYANINSEVPSAFNRVSKGDQISVSDSTGEVVYSGRVDYDGSIQKLYDFSQLKDGIYTVEVNKDFEIEINSVEVKKNVVTFSNLSSKKIYKPVFRSKDSQVIISKLAIDSNEMNIELYFENDLIHTETVKGKEILNRVYQLDNTLKGDYTAIIRANGRVFVENFKL
ncbi:hypothetical protein [Winogradskyella eximia]|uniref:hypothetical protein n=1 Tax=Winogradskyella eximia TaxID=262006 RepID=UPI00249103E3|nr:hypothetical protein [Winogradskyella eximia]|tara:strand:- start:33031 stop:33588 length:558 start_codon:yes stop_codon:yes gene_type:complete